MCTLSFLFCVFFLVWLLFFATIFYSIECVITILKCLFSNLKDMRIKLLEKMKEKKLSMTKKRKSALWCVFFTIVAVGFGLFFEKLIPFPLLEIPNFASVASNAVCVQATIFTLIVALLALVSSNNEMYLGVSIKNFYLDINAPFIIQKHLIYLGVLLIGANVFFLSCSFYNVVCTLFVYNLILVIISSFRVYKIFKSNSEAFFDDVKKNKTLILARSNDEVKSYLNDFANDWILQMSSQSLEKFDAYEKFRKNLFSDYKENDEIGPYLGLVEKRIIESSLRNTNTSVWGFKQLYDIYFDICNSMEETSMKEDVLIQHMHFGSLYTTISKALRTVDEKGLCENLLWPSFVCSVLTSLKLYPSNKKNLRYKDLDALVSFNLSIGHKLKKMNEEDLRKMGEQFLLFKHSQLFEKENEKYIVQCVFGFLVASYVDGSFEFAKKYFYGKMLRDYQLASEHVIRICLVSHCYLYYLAYRETEPFVSPNVRNLALNLLKQTKKIFYQVLSTSLYRDCNLNSNTYSTIDVFKFNLFNETFGFLSKYELWGDGENDKCSIMHECVYDFVVFCFVYLYGKYFADDCKKFELIFDNDACMMFQVEYCTDVKKKRFLEFMDMLPESDVEELDKKNKFESLYSNYEKLLESICKKHLLAKAPQRIKASFNEENLKLTKKIKEFFSNNYSSNCDNLKECVLLKASLPADFDERNILNNLECDICVNLIIKLFNELRKNSRTSVYKKREDSDDGLIDFTNSQSGATYYGPKMLLLPNDAAGLYDRYLNAISKLKEMKNIGWNLGMFIKPNDLTITIAKVSIVVEPADISSYKQYFDPEKNVYRYRHSSNSPEQEYSEAEFKNYLKLNLKELKVNADIGYQLRDGARIGFIYNPK